MGGKGARVNHSLDFPRFIVDSAPFWSQRESSFACFPSSPDQFVCLVFGMMTAAPCKCHHLRTRFAERCALSRGTFHLPHSRQILNHGWRTGPAFLTRAALCDAPSHTCLIQDAPMIKTGPEHHHLFPQVLSAKVAWIRQPKHLHCYLCLSMFSLGDINFSTLALKFLKQKPRNIQAR